MEIFYFVLYWLVGTLVCSYYIYTAGRFLTIGDLLVSTLVFWTIWPLCLLAFVFEHLFKEVTFFSKRIF